VCEGKLRESDRCALDSIACQVQYTWPSAAFECIFPPNAVLSMSVFRIYVCKCCTMVHECVLRVIRCWWRRSPAAQAHPYVLMVAPSYRRTAVPPLFLRGLVPVRCRICVKEKGLSAHQCFRSK
jgi:hypothetical protein